MPRVRRKSKTRREGLTEKHIYKLLFGHWFISPGPFAGDEDAQRELWGDLRDELLDAWIAERPGTRPWAWWEFDAPERRERIDGGIHPFDDPALDAHIERVRQECNSPNYGHNRCLHYGLPGVYLRREDTECQFESERQYLDRLGLLTDEEQDATEPRERPRWRRELCQRFIEGTI